MTNAPFVIRRAVGPCFVLVSAFFVFKFCHETKGLELEDMQG